MKAITRIYTLVVTATLAIAATQALAQDSNSPQAKARQAMVGKQAPKLDVGHWINSDGKALSLKSLRGKVVVLDFFAFW